VLIASTSLTRTLSVISRVSCRGDSLEVSSLRHLADQALLLELAAGQVDLDRQRRRVRELVLPASGLEAGLQQHPVADGPDQALLLGQGDERRRGQQALDRVVPADQRLDPGAVLASGLGRVDGHVGVAQQLVGLVRARPVGRWPRQGWP